MDLRELVRSETDRIQVPHSRSMASCSVVAGFVAGGVIPWCARLMACLAVVVGATWTLVNLDAGKSSKQSVAGGVQLDATNVGAFSTEALANAGLRDDVVRVFDYKGATQTDAGWDVNMDVSSCPTGSPGQECRSIGSASMRVQSEDARLVVTDASGDITAEERQQLLDQSSDSKEPNPDYRFTFAAIAPETPGEAEEVLIMSLYWTGEIPSSLRSTCLLEVLNESEQVV